MDIDINEDVVAVIPANDTWIVCIWADGDITADRVDAHVVTRYRSKHDGSSFLWSCPVCFGEDGGVSGVDGYTHDGNIVIVVRASHEQEAIRIARQMAVGASVAT